MQPHALARPAAVMMSVCGCNDETKPCVYLLWESFFKWKISLGGLEASDLCSMPGSHTIGSRQVTRTGYISLRQYFT